MKGDIIVLEPHHRKAAKLIVSRILSHIKSKSGRYSISIAGESGSGKSETAKAVSDELAKYNIHSVVIGQDDYFRLPPKSNDAKRREDPEWLGPHVEVNLDLMEKNIVDTLSGKEGFIKPIINYQLNIVDNEKIDLKGNKVIIAEGTYTTLLKHIDTKIFIARNRLDTLEHRQKRARGNEINDPFIEEILITEHKIIAGHIQLADFVITKNYDVIVRT